MAIDLFCGLGGWTDGLLAEGYDVIGFDITQHVYGEHRYPGSLVVQRCQEYSYMAMPWTKAKAKAAAIRADKTGEALEKLNRLFNATFRIQREACEAAGRHIPMIVENVRGAIPWVGRSRWNFGSFHLWGDVPALMPPIYRGKARLKTTTGEQWNVNRSNFTGTKPWAGSDRDESIKNSGGSWFNIGSPGQKVTNRNPVHALNAEGIKGSEGYERDHPNAFGWKKPGTSSNSPKRKFASAMIAKIPLPLSRHIASTFRPQMAEAAE